MMNIAVRTNDRFVTVDGLNIRYLEEGSGVPAILLHGSSLGSSADVFRRNLRRSAARASAPSRSTCRASARPIRRKTSAAVTARSSSFASWTRSASRRPR